MQLNVDIVMHEFTIVTFAYTIKTKSRHRKFSSKGKGGFQKLDIAAVAEIN